MATTTNLGKVHVFPSEDSYNTNKGSVGANDLALVPIGAATTSEYGLTRLASEADVLSEAEGAVVHVPLAYELNDFRRLNTAYKVGDKVNCAFRFEFYLECTQAGTTSANTLDTRNVTFGQTITDGTVKWIVRAHVKSVNGVVPDANGNINAGYALDDNVVHKTGNEEIRGLKSFYNQINVYGSTGFQVIRMEQDLTVVPEETVQTWYSRVKDKNDLTGLLIKHYQYKDGRTYVVITDCNHYNDPEDDNTGDWASLSIGHDENGKQHFFISSHPEDTDSSTKLATTYHVTQKIKNSTDIVHTTGNETIGGVKSFSSAIRSDASALIQSNPWSGISIADESRASSSTRIIGEILDKDNKRFAALEVNASSSGARIVQIVMRKRDDSGWSFPFQITEKNDGTVYATLGSNVSASDSSRNLATTKCVDDKIAAIAAISTSQIDSICV